MTLLLSKAINLIREDNSQVTVISDKLLTVHALYCRYEILYHQLA